MATSIPHNARRHASTFALELLAEEQSTTFDRSVVRAIYQIGSRDLPHATAAEWALLHLAEQYLLDLMTPDLAHVGAADRVFRTVALSMLEPAGSA
jgi:hypothetical protein